MELIFSSMLQPLKLLFIIVITIFFIIFVQFAQLVKLKPPSTGEMQKRHKIFSTSSASPFHVSLLTLSMVFRPDLITDRVRSTRGGNIFSLFVCPHRGGVPTFRMVGGGGGTYSGLDGGGGGGTYSGLDGGGVTYSILDGGGGYLLSGLDGGGTYLPRSGWGGVPTFPGGRGVPTLGRYPPTRVGTPPPRVGTPPTRVVTPPGRYPPSPTRVGTPPPG